jgi:cobalt-zinc-cadmium efflux system protein
LSDSRPSSSGRRHVRPLAVSFGMVAVFMVVEAIVGIVSGSLALVSDAGHMATDALGLGMALAAILAANRSRSHRSQTFGAYRLEIVAALANAVLLSAVAVYVIWEAMARLRASVVPQTTPMLVVAALGLVVNLVSWRLLRSGAGESLNVRGAYMEVIADLAGSLGVVVAALVTIFTGWPYADPLIAAAIGVFILPRAWRLGAQALRILIQAAPAHLDLAVLEGDLLSIPGVVDVHDLHVWTLTSEMDVASAHLTIADGGDPHPVLDRARALLLDRHAIDHATLQVEPASHRECTEASW